MCAAAQHLKYELFATALSGKDVPASSIRAFDRYRARLDALNGWFHPATQAGLRQQWFDALRPPLTDPSPEALQRREEAWQQWGKTRFRAAVGKPRKNNKISNLANFIRDNVSFLHALSQDGVVGSSRRPTASCPTS